MTSKPPLLSIIEPAPTPSEREIVQWLESMSERLESMSAALVMDNSERSGEAVQQGPASVVSEVVQVPGESTEIEL